MAYYSHHIPNHKQAALGLGVPSREQQALEMLAPETQPLAARHRGKVHGVVGGLGGAALGAALGAPFGGVGAIPGAVVGGLTGGVGLPLALEAAAKPETSAGRKLLELEANSDLLREIAVAKRRRLLLNLLVGGSAGAAAGLPFAGIGALPGAGLGLVAGGLYNSLTESPAANSLIDSNEGVRLRKGLEKAVAAKK